MRRPVVVRTVAVGAVLVAGVVLRVVRLVVPPGARTPRPYGSPRRGTRCSERAGRRSPRSTPWIRGRATPGCGAGWTPRPGRCTTSCGATSAQNRQKVAQAQVAAAGTVTDLAVTELDTRAGTAQVIATVQVDLGTRGTQRKRFTAVLARTGKDWKLTSLTAVPVGAQ